jgi:PAS domain S-box-containing protein
MKDKMNKNNKSSHFSSQEFISEMLEYLPTRVFWKDKEGVYVGCNSAFARSVLLSKPEDVLGKTDYDLPVKKEDSDAYREDDKEVMSTGLPKLNIEEKQTLENGQEIFLLTSKVPLFDKGGEVIGVLGVYSDITREKQAQEALKQANHAARMEFIYTASHEVINHVSCVVSFAERLERSLTTLKNTLLKKIDADEKTSESESALQVLAEMREDCQDIRSSAEGGITSIRNISALHYMQLNKITARPELVGVQQFLDSAIRKSTYSNTHYIQVERSICPSVPSDIMMDASNVMAALSIVVGNAFRFSRPGDKIQITVKKARENKESCVVISVQDFGVGMHEAQIKKLLMSPLESEQDLYSKPSVQLSRVKMYLEASEGRLEIESVLNQGTEVKLIVPYTLPVQEKSAEKEVNNSVESEVEGEK